MKLTNYHCKYIAYDLTKKSVQDNERLSVALFNAAVDLNPHQIDAALFALKSPLSMGTILADEVGLGKTIEAGIVVCQYWAERRRKILIITPASIRKQWTLELEEKFNLPAIILDSKTYHELKRNGRHPFQQKAIIIASYNFVNKIKEEIKTLDWDLVVIDEAHKLRNAYRSSNRIGQGIRWATESCRKLLLTATPLQNSLLELYGLTSLIDENIFGDVNSFRSQYMNTGGSISELRERLRFFCKRTLRNQVVEYISYTKRRAITRPFHPTDVEHKFYEAISTFLQREESYAIPHRQKHLTQIILRKLLASSSKAIAATLRTMIDRLEKLKKDGLNADTDLVQSILTDEEIEDELLDEILEGQETVVDYESVNLHKLNEEIAELKQLENSAHAIGTDTKTHSLLISLAIGFNEMETSGAARKALIFTESRRTQEYLAVFLESNGFEGQIVLFNGSNNSPATTEIYKRWQEKNRSSGRVSYSRDIDIRTALVEHFRDNCSIMIATEAGSEGINLQFCSLVINYDLPWNPQRVEQRIGRCHRYGQKFDVVVINFLNERNDADRRVLELLTEKFQLFSGVFGASDEILGSIESGVDFEKRILAIYQECRTPEEIETGFRILQDEMDEVIRARMETTRKMLFENFDEDVHDRLRVRLNTAREQLDRFSKRFWDISKAILWEFAEFNDENLSFHLKYPPNENYSVGIYHMISKEHRIQNYSNDLHDSYLYRLNHPLGEYVIESSKSLETPLADLTFSISEHPANIYSVEQLIGKSGYLTLNLLKIESYELEDYLLFSGFDDMGTSLDQETCEKLFSCLATTRKIESIPNDIHERLVAEGNRHVDASISLSLEANNKYFHEAREKLEKWADDMVLSAEKALKETKEQIKANQREARQSVTLEDQHMIQEKIRNLEKLQRKQRQEIFVVEDEIISKRDELISKLEKRLAQKKEIKNLFTIRWRVV
ncbi:helicase-like protein [Leptospira meyeri]|uniref:Helicase-like protein n=2 Tax=Leptospira meyeri TaxID=29508 RepID=A0A4R8MJ55_LEPME|nr:SNF2-related protein [Leptospira meyeri]EKJ86154.1 DEAD/DEAH box helicase [Leptospira meyeri serovar Hardjo str. Went 5]TDY66532.1 helicase-like protein [Leptospira meyeri]